MTHPPTRTGASGHRAGRRSASSNPPGRREAIVDLLRAAAQPRTILQLADELRVHPNTVRFHIEELRRSGLVEQVLGEVTGPGRPPVLFRATRRMDPTGPTNYRLLAAVLTSHLESSSPDPAATAVALGRSWAGRLVDTGGTRKHARRVGRGDALSRVTGVLSELGFAPEPSGGPRDTTIRLRHCPFLGLVAGDEGLVSGSLDGEDGGGEGLARVGGGGGHGKVICALHLGMMQGVLASLDGPVTVDRLEPFAEPDLCVAHLAPASSASGTRTVTDGSHPAASGQGKRQTKG